MSSLPPVGLAGLGTMGSLLGERLLDQGVPLIVYNRSREKMRPLVERGAVAAHTPADLAAAAQVVLTVVTGPDALRALVLGEAGLARSARPASVICDLSTQDPGELVAI